MSTTTTTDPTQTTTCPRWCAEHADDGEGGIVHKAAVTERGATIELEIGPENDGLPILLPEIMGCDAPAARDLAAALVEAARLVEGDAPPTDNLVSEVGWVAREARALVGDPDPERRARFEQRKRALLEAVARG